MSAHIQYMMNTARTPGWCSAGTRSAPRSPTWCSRVPFDFFGFKAPLPAGADQHIAAVALFGNGSRLGRADHELQPGLLATGPSSCATATTRSATRPIRTPGKTTGPPTSPTPTSTRAWRIRPPTSSRAASSRPHPQIAGDPRAGLEFVVGRIVDPDQRQPLRRRRREVARAPRRRQQRGAPTGFAPMLADGQQGADQRPHHRPAERVGGDVRGDAVAVARPVQPLQFADGRGAFTVAAERGEVMQPQQVPRRGRHGIDVQRPRPWRDEAGVLRLDTVRRRRQPVLVVPAQRGEPRVETRCGAGDVEHPHILGQEPREPSHQRQELGARRRSHRARIRVRQRVGGHVDVGDLTRGMHAGVGASRRARHAPACGTRSTARRRARPPPCAARPAPPSPRIRFRRRRCRAEDERARHRNRWRARS